MNDSMDILVRSVKLIDKLDYWNRVRDWSEDRLNEQFRLDDDATRLLRAIILCKTDPAHNVYDLPAEKGQLFLETVQEVLHQGFDGWSEREGLIIEAFLGDVAYAMTLM